MSVTFHSIYYEVGVTNIRSLLAKFRSCTATANSALTLISQNKEGKFTLPSQNIALRIRVSHVADEMASYKEIMSAAIKKGYLLTPTWVAFFLTSIAEERRKQLDLGNREEYIRILGFPYEDGHGKKIFTLHSTPYGCVLNLNKLNEKEWKPDRLWVTVAPNS